YARRVPAMRSRSGAPPEPARLRVWESAFDAILDPIAVADGDGIVRGANRAFRHRFAAAGEEVVGQRLATLLYGENDAEHGELSASHITYETSSLRVPGTFLASHAPLDLGDRPGRVVHLSDVTAQRAAEEAAREGEAHVRQAQKVDAVGRLAGGV